MLDVVSQQHFMFLEIWKRQKGGYLWNIIYSFNIDIILNNGWEQEEAH